MRKASRFISIVVLLVALAGFSGGQLAHASASSARITRISSAVVPCSQVGTKHLAKTRFLLHAGLGIGAFKHFVYDPFKAGKFNSGAPGRVKSLAIAGAAALFAYHQLKVAKGFAESDKTLCKLVAPIDGLTAKLSSLGSGLKSGKLDEAGINSTAQNVASLKGSATKLGAPVTEQVPASVGAS
jgi:hypothetical protein